MSVNRGFKFPLDKKAKRGLISVGMNNSFKLVLIAFLSALVLAGCATVENDKAFQNLSRQVSELKTSLDEKDARLQELSGKFSLLHEKVEENRVLLEKLKSAEQAPAPQPVQPPEGLKVVPLTEDHARDTEVRPKTDASDMKEKGEPEGLYGRAQELLNAGRHDEARKAFLSLVRSHPESSLADNALYWIGESYYNEKDFEKAASGFMEAAEKYPDGNKAPDALYKAALSYVELHKDDSASKAFKKLIKRYPKTEAAAKAKKALDKPGRR